MIKHSSYAKNFVTNLSHLANSFFLEDAINAFLSAMSSIQDKQANRNKEQELCIKYRCGVTALRRDVKVAYPEFWMRRGSSTWQFIKQ